MKTIFTKTFVTLIFIFIIQMPCNAQSVSIDLDTILNHGFFKPKVVNKPKFLFIPEKGIIKYNPISLTLGCLMFFYQSVISKQIAAECPYEISCSNYSKAVLARYGLLKGIALTSYRLMRCNQIAAVDINPLDINAAGKIIDDPEEYKLNHK